MEFVKSKLFGNSIKTRGLMLLSAAVISNVLNLVYNAYLGRSLALGDFALISLIGSVLALSDIPVSALSKTVTYRTAYLSGKYKAVPDFFWKSTRRRMMLFIVIASILWVLMSPIISSFFKIDGLLPVLSLTPIWFLTVLSAVDGGYIGGNLKFGYMAAVTLIEAVVKLIAAFLIVQLGFGEYAYFAIFLSFVVSAALVFRKARTIRSGIKKIAAKKYAFPRKFFLFNAFTKVSAVIYLTADILLAKHFLSPDQAGQYALLSLSGKMVFFAGSLFSQFILPLVSHKEGSGQGSHSVFYKLLGASFVSSFAAFIVIGFFGKYTMPFVFGEKALSIISLLPAYCLSMVGFTLASNIALFQQIKGKYALSFIGLVLAFIQILGIVVFHNSVSEISSVMVYMGFASFVVMSLLYLFDTFYGVVASNIRDIIGAFQASKGVFTKPSGLKILIFNWRDKKHTWSGGAEVYVHELAKQWVKNGNSVTIFCGSDRLASRNEEIDGVKIVRRGGFYTVYLWAVLYYATKFRGKFDVIIDSENGIPFFTPLFSLTPVVLLIHHVHQDVFLEQMRFPLSHIAKFIEGRVMPFVYKNKTVITVSQSSKEEIVKLGIAKSKDVQIINPGIEIKQVNVKKSPYPMVIYLGRLKAYKNIDVAIRAFKLVSQKIDDAKLLIVGEGESMGDLKNLVAELELTGKVEFMGKVTEKKKVELLAQSWVAVQPSQLEGWGITVIEANAYKTPVIASDTKGLCDSVIDGVTGRLIKTRDVRGFASALNDYLTNATLRQSSSNAAYEWAKNFSWEKSAADFHNVVGAVSLKKPFIDFKPVSYAVNRITSLF